MGAKQSFTGTRSGDKVAPRAVIRETQPIAQFDRDG
jgi:hypothetical protein